MERTPCIEFREELLLNGASASEHARTCEPCARWAARRVAREELVRSLPRCAAPAELDSRVVAALQAGARQERAIRALERLARVSPPKELDAAVTGTFDEVAGLRAAAPQVLERLVTEELADLPKARARRFIGSLPRLHAPTSLTARVARTAQAELAPRPSRLRFAWISVAAAALILAVAAPILLQLSGGARRERPFREERVGSIGALDPLSHSMLDAASGGLLQLHKI